MAEEKPAMARRFRGFMPVVVDVETGGFDHKKDALLELAAVLLTENSQYSILEQAITTGILMLVLLVVLVLMLLASHIHRIFGDSGASIISRIMGLVFGSVAVSNMLAGITDYFGL